MAPLTVLLLLLAVAQSTAEGTLYRGDDNILELTNDTFDGNV